MQEAFGQEVRPNRDVDWILLKKKKLMQPGRIERPADLLAAFLRGLP